MNPAFHPPGDQEALQPVDLDHGSSSSLRLENVSAAAAKADPCSVARAAGYRPAYNSPPAGYRAPTAAAAAAAAAGGGAGGGPPRDARRLDPDDPPAAGGGAGPPRTAGNDVIKPKEARSPTDDDLSRMMDELELQLSYRLSVMESKEAHSPTDEELCRMMDAFETEMAYRLSVSSGMGSPVRPVDAPAGHAAEGTEGVVGVEEDGGLRYAWQKRRSERNCQK